MTFADDEQIAPAQPVSGSEAIAQGRILEIPSSYKPNAPPNECTFKVLLEIMGEGKDGGSDRHGLDLVLVLDISGSMRDEEKLVTLKKAVQFVIRKLSPTDDRLSVVAFNGRSERLFPLRRTEQSLNEMEDSVNDLVAHGSTNIAAGLQMGLQVLNDRRQKDGRAYAIMLMSDGEAYPPSNAAEKVKVSDVPVFTFGFGHEQDAKALSTIAANSHGGTYSDVGNVDHLSIAFAQCLGGLLSVAVQDLKLTVEKRDSNQIKILSPLGYPQSENKTEGSITISFGNLYIKEVRKILVELQLPAAEDSDEETQVLGYSYSYRIDGGEPAETNTEFVAIPRTAEPGDTSENEEVVMEEKRVLITKLITEARFLADDNKLKQAQGKLNDARAILEADKSHDSNPTIIMLKHEVEHFLSKLSSTKDYHKEGRPFAHSCESSHHTQRFALRGDPKLARHFATPHMDEHHEHARSFHAARG